MYSGDYHTHTTLSHGSGSLEDNIKAAIAAGLKEIAITDHGFGHRTYAVKRKEWYGARADIALLRKQYPQIKILLGLECNIISANGDVDLLEGERDTLDIMVCGFHRLVKANSMKDSFGFCLPNLMGAKSPKMIAKNTDAYIKLIEKHSVDVISHLNYSIVTDAVEVARACREYGVFLELNGKRINLTDAEIEKITEEGTQFIVDSDAHSPQKVGDFAVPQSVIDRIKIPEVQIANLNKTPKFRSVK